MMLREVLQAAGLATNTAFAKAVGITAQRAWMFWHGERRLTVDMALQIHEATGIPLADLLRAEPGERWKAKQPA